MSRGKNLQEMENAVTRGAKPAEKMQTMAGVSYEDLGGPTPENYRPDDDSAKLGTASAAGVPDGAHARNLASVKGVMARKEEVETEEEIIAESEEAEEELIETEEDAEELPEVSDEVDVEEDVNALLGGEELSEEFRDKAKTIFEAALKSKVVEIREALEARYEAQLIEEVEAMKVELVERVDSYLEYVADEWVTENALQIEQGLKTEMTESFLAGMKGLFEDHYVTIPEDKYDVIESMVDKLDEMEAKLNEQIERNVALNRRLAESVADVIFAEVTEGLALSQKDKLASLAENVEFESEADYREKLVTLRESYFPTNAGTQRDNSENLSEENSSSNYQPVSGLMESYLQTLNRVSKK